MPRLTPSGSPTLSGTSVVLDTTDRLTAETSLVSDSQGWIAIRLRPSWAAATPPTAGPRVIEIGAVGKCLFDTTTSKWKTEMAGRVSFSAVQSFLAATDHTAVFSWTPTNAGTSADGGAFVNTAGSFTVDTPIKAEIGNRSAADRSLESEVFWVIGGSGILSDADAATIDAFGNTPPTWDMIPGAPVFLWDATTLEYRDVSSFPSVAVDFTRHAFPFIIGDGFMQGISRAGAKWRASGRAGPSPMGGFERSLFPRLHSVYVATSIDANLGLLQESSAEFGMIATRDAALALISETDSPAAMTAQKTAALSLLSELDSFASMPATKNAALGLLSSSNSLLGASPLKQALLTQLLETDTLLSPAAQRIVPLGLLLETDSLNNFLGIPINVVLGLLSEADALLAASGNKAAQLGLLSTTNSVFSTAAVRAVTLGLLAANNTLFGVTSTRDAQLGLLSTTSSALSLAGTKTALLNILSESDLLLSGAGSKNASLGLLSEADALTAIQLSMLRAVLLGILTETDQLVMLRPPRGLVLTPEPGRTLVLTEAVTRFP